jgi:hypothetical protein
MGGGGGGLWQHKKDRCPLFLVGLLVILYIESTRGVLKAKRLPSLLAEDSWSLGTVCFSEECPSHFVYFLQCPVHLSDMCSRPFPDVLHRVMAVDFFTSVSVLTFWPCSSCLSVADAKKSHVLMSRQEGGHLQVFHWWAGMCAIFTSMSGEQYKIRVSEAA